MPTEQNVSRSEYLFLNSETGFEKQNGYETYYDYIVTKKSDIDLDIKDVGEIHDSLDGTDYFDFICGKFLLTSLFVYLRGKNKRKFYKMN